MQRSFEKLYFNEKFLWFKHVVCNDETVLLLEWYERFLSKPRERRRYNKKYIYLFTTR